MFCEGCGSAMEENSLFCANCGWKVPDSFQIQNLEEEPSNGASNMQEQSLGGMQEPSYGSMGNASYGAQEPSYGSMSNASYGAQEPSYGSMSNASYGAQEPSYGSMGNAGYGYQEPSYGSMSNTDYGYQNSSYNGMPQQNYGGPMDMGNGVYDSFAGQTQMPQPKQKKKFSFKSPKFIVPVSIVAVLAICCIFLWEYVANFCLKTFASDDTYYQYVEKKNALQLSESVTDGYGVYVTALKDVDGKTQSGTLTFELGEGGREILEEYTQDLSGLGLDDLSWCSTVSMDYQYIIDGNKLYYEFSFKLSTAKIISAKMTYDMDAGMMYVQIPEISDAYFSIEMGYRTAMGIGSTLSGYADVADELPSQKKVDSLLAKYLEIIIDSINKVDQGSSTIEADGISAKYTELAYTIDAKLITNICENIYKEAKNDKELKSLCDDILELSGMSYYYDDDYYSDMMEELKDFVDEMKEASKQNNEKLGVMKVWVDGKGNVVGREFTVESGYQDVKIAYYAPEKGDKTGFLFTIEMNSSVICSIEGSGKKSGDMLTGSYSINAMDYEIARVSLDKYDLGATKEGRASGSITLSFGRDLSDFIEYYYEENYYYSDGSEYAAIVDALTDYSLKIDLECNDKSAKIAVSLLDQKNVLFKLSSSSTVGSNGKVPSVPTSNVYDIDWEGDQYLQTCNFEKYMRDLDKSVFPEEIRRILEKLANADFEDWEDILDEEMDSVFGY